jgi:serine/threonine protein kinase
MAALHILKGANEGTLVPLDGNKFVLGRNPDCGIVIPVTSVSREHAQILRVQGRYFIEDKQSRNGTYVNNQAITTRTLLKSNDRVRICDFLAVFVDQKENTPLELPEGIEEVSYQLRVRIRAVVPLSLAGGVSTPDYLAPWQIAEPAEGSVKSARDDLHAVGVIAFQMLLGRLPFPTEPLMERLDAIAQKRFDSAAEGCRLAGIDGTLAPLIDRALAGGYVRADIWRGELGTKVPLGPRQRATPSAPPEQGEAFVVERLLFEDVLSEAYKVRGASSGGRFTMRLFKPGFHSPPFLRILRDLPGTGQATAVPAAELLQRYVVGRAGPLPVSPGALVEINPDLNGPGCPCLVEEDAGERTLMDLIRSGALRGDSRRVAYLLRQVLDALDYTHAQGCVHGNLTPYCLFVGEGDLLKLEGFGLHAELEELRMEQGGDAMLTSSNLLLEQQPAEKLRGLLEISANLSKTLDLDELMPKIVDSLFQLFRQADRCFVIQAEEGTNRLLPRVVRTRRPNEDQNARPSRTIVRRCLESGQAFLTNDASRDDRIQLSQSVVDFRIRSVMCVPLTPPGGDPFGVIQLDTQDRSKTFTQEHLNLLWGVANQAAIALENAACTRRAWRRHASSVTCILRRESRRASCRAVPPIFQVTSSSTFTSQLVKLVGTTTVTSHSPVGALRLPSATWREGVPPRRCSWPSCPILSASP